MAVPEQAHMTAAKQVVRYLQGTLQKGLMFSAEDIMYHIYSDAYFAGCVQTRRSATAFGVITAGACVQWSSKLQPNVALSTSEAEYMALAAATREWLWLRNILQFLGLYIKVSAMWKMYIKVSAMWKINLQFTLPQTLV